MSVGGSFWVEPNGSRFLSILRLLLCTAILLCGTAANCFADDRYGESQVGLPPLPETRYDAYDFYRLGFLPDAYPGRRVDGEVVAHPMYGAYVIFDYLRLYREGNGDQYLAAAQRVADATLARMERIESHDALAFYFEADDTLSYFSGRFYSGLVQARYLIPLTQLAIESGENRYAEASYEVLNSLQVPKSEGGVMINSAFGPAIEEYPHDVPTFVLNGWTTIILELLKYAELADYGPARQLAIDNIKTVERLLPLYDVPDLLLSRYQLGGFVYTRMTFSQPSACRVSDYEVEVNGVRYALLDSDNRWHNFIVSADVDEAGYVVKRVIRINNVLSQADEKQNIYAQLDCRQPVSVDVSVAAGDYNPTLSGMPTQRWVWLGRYDLTEGANDVPVEFTRSSIPLVGYPTNFNKKIAGSNYNVYHWLHIMNLRRIAELHPSDLFSYYADRWEAYTDEWKRVPVIRNAGFSFDCPPTAGSCDDYGDVN